jgi:hypothetical protein
MAWSEQARRAALEARRRKRKTFSYTQIDPEAGGHVKYTANRKRLLQDLGQAKRDARGTPGMGSTSVEPWFREAGKKNVARLRRALYGKQRQRDKKQFKKAPSFQRAYGH